MMRKGWIYFFGLLAFALPLFCVGQSDGKDLQYKFPSIVKLGYMQGELFGGSILASYERSFRKNFSAQATLGALPINPVRNSNYAFLSTTIGIEGRYYFAFNKRKLEGAYIGPHFAIHNVFYYYRTPKSIATQIFWPQFGATFGFQKQLFGRFAACAFVNGGYVGSISFKSYRQDGVHLGTTSDPLTITAFGGLSLGYKF